MEDKSKMFKLFMARHTLTQIVELEKIVSHFGLPYKISFDIDQDKVESSEENKELISIIHSR